MSYEHNIHILNNTINSAIQHKLRYTELDTNVDIMSTLLLLMIGEWRKNEFL